MAANHDATIAEFAEKLRTGTMTPADMNKRLAVAAVSAFLDEAPKNGRPGYTLLTAVAHKQRSSDYAYDRERPDRSDA